MVHDSRSALFIALTVGASALLATGCVPPRAYDPCGTDTDCPAGTTCERITTSGDRICTTACSSTVGCPTDYYGIVGTCLSFDGGANSTCWQTCSSDYDCAVGYACLTEDAAGRTFPPICLPSRGSYATRDAYQTCTSSSQCLGGLSCVGINSSAMCTSGCYDSSDCSSDVYGYAAECISFGGSGFTCFQSCDRYGSGVECPTGWGCFDNDGYSSFPPVCLPG